MNEFRASGLPLGLLRNIRYEERAAQLFPGDTVLFYSDGLVEAHNERRELFGFPRMTSLMQQHDGGAGLIDGLLGALHEICDELPTALITSGAAASHSARRSHRRAT